MRLICPCQPAFVISLLALLACAPGQPQSTTAADEAAIVRILAEPGRSRHTSPDLDWENAFGVRRRGLAEVVAYLDDRVYPTMSQARDTTLEIRVNFVAPDIAVADQYWRLTGQTDEPGGPAMADRQGRDTYVFRRESGR